MDEDKIIDRIVETILIVGAVVLVILNIFGIINIPWIWLLAPIWIPLVIGTILGIGLGIWCLIDTHINK